MTDREVNVMQAMRDALKLVREEKRIFGASRAVLRAYDVMLSDALEVLGDERRADATEAVRRGDAGCMDTAGAVDRGVEGDGGAVGMAGAGRGAVSAGAFHQ